MPPREIASPLDLSESEPAPENAPSGVSMSLWTEEEKQPPTTNKNSGALKNQGGATTTTTNTTTTTLKSLDQSVRMLPHNTFTANIGFRCCTFHWELNAWTALFLTLVFYTVLPPLHRRWMATVFLSLVAIDAGRYYLKKGNLPGVPYTLPFVNLIAMIVHPVRFWAELGTIAMMEQNRKNRNNGSSSTSSSSSNNNNITMTTNNNNNNNSEGLCTNVMVGHFMIFVTDTPLCREIMTAESSYGIYAHPNALWLFGPKNLIYMKTDAHKAFRAILTPALFGKEALAQYAHAQETVCRRFLNQYALECSNNNQSNLKALDVRVAFRAMAAASSQEAFLGPYLTDELRVHLEADIVTFTMGFLSFPFPYFNSGLHRAIQAKDRIEATIQSIVPKARAWIEAGNEPRCLMERWSVAIKQEAAAQGIAVTDIPYCGDDDMARTVLDFLFAAQDATNSALAFSLDVLDEDRVVFDKMRQEMDNNGGTKESIWTKLQTEGATAAIPYTSKVANQLLHHKPPVPMIPHMAKKDSVLAGRRIAKGTIVIPSITYSARTSGASVDFLPERPDADAQFVKTVVFGAGQHKCPGRRYAESLLTVFLAVLAQEFDFCRAGRRPTVDEFVYYPTTFPKDCHFIIKARNEK